MFIAFLIVFIAVSVGYYKLTSTEKQIVNDTSPSFDPAPSPSPSLSFDPAPALTSSPSFDQAPAPAPIVYHTPTKYGELWYYTAGENYSDLQLKIDAGVCVFETMPANYSLWKCNERRFRTEFASQEYLSQAAPATW